MCASATHEETSSTFKNPDREHQNNGEKERERKRVALEK